MLGRRRYSRRSLDSATGRALMLDNQAAPDRLSGTVLLLMGCTSLEKSRMSELGRCRICLHAQCSARLAAGTEATFLEIYPPPRIKTTFRHNVNLAPPQLSHSEVFHPSTSHEE